MSLIEGMEDIITHTKNQELRIQKLEEENKDLKELKEKLKRNDKKMYQLLKQETDSHAKTLNNMFEAFNLSEQNTKQAELNARRFTNAESLQGHYRTLIGEWYIMCFKAQNNNKIKELKELKELYEGRAKGMEEELNKIEKLVGIKEGDIPKPNQVFNAVNKLKEENDKLKELVGSIKKETDKAK